MVDVAPGSGDDASVRIVTDRQGFVELAQGNVGERVQIDGDLEALTRLQRVFRLT